MGKVFVPCGTGVASVEVSDAGARFSRTTSVPKLHGQDDNATSER